MSKALILLQSLLLGWSVNTTLDAQSLYFPPVIGEAWETLDPSTLGWCPDRLAAMYNLLEENNTKAFILLKDGRIVLEHYFGSFTTDSLWYWASAGKGLTASLIGIAQQEGHLSIDDLTSDYLGQGWTTCAPEQEDQITIRHQLTMTSGLDDQVGDPYCTLDTCLQFLADAGTRWAYHNAPYTLLDDVLSAATGQNLNLYFQQRVRNQTGINGLFLPVGYNNVFFSRPRSMARFGLWILAEGAWNGQPVLSDTTYFNQMVNTSQSLNLSYGYLWWLNGKPSYRLPGLQFVFPGSLMPHAPSDMIAALGKNGQYVNVVPSMNLVLIRMGEAPEGNEVPVTLNDKIWEHIRGLECETALQESLSARDVDLIVYPNPAKAVFSVLLHNESFDFWLFDAAGRMLHYVEGCYNRLDLQYEWPAGIYFIQVLDAAGIRHYRRIQFN